MLSAKMKERNPGRIELKDCRLQTGQALLFYLYNGWLEPEASVTELLVLADRYDLAELKETCASSLKSSITEQNCLEVSCLLLRVADPERFDQDPTFDVDAEPDPNFTCCR